MDNADLVEELDRNMDTVFDNLFVLNAAIEAIVQSLPPDISRQAAHRMNAALDTIVDGKNPPSEFYRGLLVRWQLFLEQRAGTLPPAQ